MPELAALAPDGNRRMGANPHVNGGRVLKALDLPDFAQYALAIPGPGRSGGGSAAQAGRISARRDQAESRQFPHCSVPDETNSNRLNAVFEATNRCTHGADRFDRRSSRSRRARDGSAQRASLRRLARGLSADRQARHVVFVRGVRAGGGFDGHAARQMDGAMPRISLAQADRFAECFASPATPGETITTDSATRRRDSWTTRCNGAAKWFASTIRRIPIAC